VMIAGYFYYGGFGIHLGRSFQYDRGDERQEKRIICENPCMDLFYNLELFRDYRNDNRISSAACFKYLGNPIYDRFRCLRWNDLQIAIDCHQAFII
jgi:hypothetical protein